MFEHILVAVDFSPAWQRLQAQPERLRSLGCNRLTLVHVRGGARDEREAEKVGGAAKRLEEAAATLHGEGFALDAVVGTGPNVLGSMTSMRNCWATAGLRQRSRGWRRNTTWIW